LEEAGCHTQFERQIYGTALKYSIIKQSESFFSQIVSLVGEQCLSTFLYVYVARNVKNDL